MLSHLRLFRMFIVCATFGLCFLPFAMPADAPSTPASQASPPREAPYLISADPIHQFVAKHLKNIPVFSEDFRLSIGGQFRYRMEYREDFDFNRTRDDRDAFSLFRSRANGSLALWDWLRVFAEFQDAQVAGSRRQNQGNAFQNLMDLRQGYVELKWPGGRLRNLTGIKLLDHVAEHSHFRAGRQELAYGDERFVGAFDWSNVTQTFDALRYIYDTKDRSLDLFWAQIVKIQDGEPDSGDRRNNLLGVYWSEKSIPSNTIDTFLFVRQNDKVRYFSEQPRQDGPLGLFTLGNRWKGKYKRLDYGTEYAFQFGRRAHDDVEAFAFHQELGLTLPLPFSPRPNAEYNFGSGDENPTDGHYNIFDNLYPTNHNKYGYIDFASLQNIHDVRIGIDIEPLPRIKAACDFHFFYLDDEASPWFSAARTVIRRGNPRASKTLGKELDLLLTWQLAKQVKLLVGYSRWFSGPFVKDTGSHADADFFYVQTQVDF